MNVKFGKGKTKYGSGVQIDLTGAEVATAIDAYLVAHKIHVFGKRTITINNELCKKGGIYIDPSGCIVADGVVWNGKGKGRNDNVY